ncbi:MAG: hypothetical protein ACOY0T_27670 [Myxococcota bacterium]
MAFWAPVVAEHLRLHDFLPGAVDAAPEWSCPDLANRFDCLNQLGALVSNSMGDT